jgi:hypothetical protein
VAGQELLGARTRRRAEYDDSSKPDWNRHDVIVTPALRAQQLLDIDSAAERVIMSWKQWVNNDSPAVEWAGKHADALAELSEALYRYVGDVDEIDSKENGDA